MQTFNVKSLILIIMLPRLSAFYSAHLACIVCLPYWSAVPSLPLLVHPKPGVRRPRERSDPAHIHSQNICLEFPQTPGEDNKDLFI